MNTLLLILGLTLSLASFASGPCSLERVQDIRPSQLQVTAPLQIPSHHTLIGTESGGGGGGVVILNAQPVMLDFFQVLNAAEIDLRQTSPAQPMARPCTFRLEDGGAQQYPAFQAVFEILAPWEARPFDTISSLVRTIFGGALVWNFTESNIPAPPFHRPALLPAATIHTAAYYQKIGSQFQVNIHLPLWRQMDLENQTALLLHEALRQLQIGWGVEFSEEALQQATAIYLLCQPHSRLNYYLFMVLNNGPELAQRTYGSYSAVMEQSCRSRL